MINIKAISRILGILSALNTTAMFIPLTIALYDYFSDFSELNVFAMVSLSASIMIGYLVSFSLYVYGRKSSDHIVSSDAMALVTFSWLVASAVAALPFFLWGHLTYNATGLETPFINYINCIFETVSGFTTTGASILTNFEVVPDSLMFWRAMVQWFGGLGIVVLFVAVLPMITGKNRSLYSAETTGISTDSTTPKIQDAARRLWSIYCLITLVQVILMMASDWTMTAFDAFTFAFSSAATAGFSIFSDSAGSLKPLTQWIIVIFMMIAGVNYALYEQLSRGKFKKLFNDEEFRWYLIIQIAASILIAFNIYNTSYLDMSGNEASKALESVIRDSAFQVVSINTTTGFSTADSNMWPLFSQYILIALMFIGGSGGSTGGGVKVSRVIAGVKLIYSNLEKSYRPNVVRPIRVCGQVINEQAKTKVLIHLLVIVLFSFAGAFLIDVFENEIDASTAFSASIACLNNIGPGFSGVGATSNYAWMSNPSKLLLILWMLIGRLEVFTVVVLFTPKFWRQK